jgi:uncharacterized iron-regulated protein
MTWHPGVPPSPATSVARSRAIRLALTLSVWGGTATPALAQAATPSDVILEGSTDAPLTREALLQRLQGADFVLLGEVHDNATQHRLRAELIGASASSKPAIVFEQFPWGADSVLQTQPTLPIEDWLDRAGFDRKNWHWPLHQPLVDVVVEYDLPRYGSQLNRDRLRPIMQGGPAAAPPPLGNLMVQVPLSEAGAQALEQTLAEGHCGELPPEMVPMMRIAQEARDAAMTEALLRAARGGHPAWLIAGNGHVGRDYGVPRFLALLAPTKQVVVVGFLEREPDGALPSEADRKVYDVVWVTERAEREDPCAAMRKQ